MVVGGGAGNRGGPRDGRLACRTLDSGTRGLGSVAAAVACPAGGDHPTSSSRAARARTNPALSCSCSCLLRHCHTLTACRSKLQRGYLSLDSLEPYEAWRFQPLYMHPLHAPLRRQTRAKMCIHIAPPPTESQGQQNHVGCAAQPRRRPLASLAALRWAMRGVMLNTGLAISARSRSATSNGS